MKALGRHIVAELSHCNSEILTDLDRVQAAMVQAALVARAEIRELAFHRFYPTGVSGVVVLAESHLAIHTWPDVGYAAIDVYTCGDTAEPMRACRFLAEQFGCQDLQTTVMDRGIPSPDGSYGHQVTVTESREQLLAVSTA
ncbi:MAG: S-adenosylmethionine decarboxylase proenzyme [Candidatus Eremiobacteraeota bacterium]|nr:S-adenosylmethionine decarboxylase proenzyme [Candidatus Eremiobacteraeota bacterium]